MNGETEMVQNVISQMYRKLFYHDQWFLAVFDRNESLTKGSPNKLATPSLKGDFYADPFLFKKEGVNYIFYEDFIYAESKGVISCMRYENGEFVDPQIVLKRDYHLSYPFVFRWNDEIYMIPETSQNRTIELYRCTDFPREWQLERVLMENVCAADTTLVHLGDRWWMFTNIWQTNGLENTDLFLFYSNSLLGDWKSHPKNPIVSDIHSARPAGNLYFEKGSLIRPSQDCSVHYGYSVKLNKIEVLSDEDYKEESIEEINPDWHLGNRSTHTLNRNEDLQIIDGQKLIVDLWKVPRKLAVVFNRLKNGGGARTEKIYYKNSQEDPGS